MLQARSLSIPAKNIAFSFCKVFNLQTIYILYMEQTQQNSSCLSTALRNAASECSVKHSGIFQDKTWEKLDPRSRTLTVTMKRCSTYKLACAPTSTDETRAHTLATFSTFVLKLRLGIQSSTCVTLTGNKPQHSLGNRPCSTNAKLTSCSFPLPFTDHFKSSRGCKSRTCSLHTHNPTSLNSWRPRAG